MSKAQFTKKKVDQSDFKEYQDDIRDQRVGVKGNYISDNDDDEAHQIRMDE